MKLFEQMARTMVAWKNCIKSDNIEWKNNHAETMSTLMDLLPHGSGIDASWNTDVEKCGDDRLEFYCSYHNMNEGGYYDGWTDFTVIVKPSLMFGCHVKITGAFPPKYRETKDYLHEIIEYALTRELVDGCLKDPEPTIKVTVSGLEWGNNAKSAG